LKLKEEKKARPSDIKKREAEDNVIKNAKYTVCLIDGDIEKVANYNIEPPGVFRGRGEHPHMGKVKSRVVPEYTSINIGFDNPIPPCPIPGHAWKKVTYNPEATWLAHFKDEKNTYSSSNTGKYLFLAAESKLKGQND
jgi:DNA topoisomerase-1